MNLRPVYLPVEETHHREALPFPPSPLTVPSVQPPELPDLPPRGDRLDALQGTDDLEVHQPTLPWGTEASHLEL